MQNGSFSRMALYRSVVVALGALVLCGCGTLTVTSEPPGARVVTRGISPDRRIDYRLITDVGLTNATPVRVRALPNRAVKVIWPDGTESAWKIHPDIWGFRSTNMVFHIDSDRAATGDPTQVCFRCGWLADGGYFVPPATATPLTIPQLDAWHRLLGYSIPPLQPDGTPIIVSSFLVMSNNTSKDMMAEVRLRSTQETAQVSVPIQAGAAFAMPIRSGEYDLTCRDNAGGAVAECRVSVELLNRYLVLVQGGDHPSASVRLMEWQWPNFVYGREQMIPRPVSGPVPTNKSRIVVTAYSKGAAINMAYYAIAVRDSNRYVGPVGNSTGRGQTLNIQ